MLIDEELTARIEPFDSFWEAPKNVDKGYNSFGKFYRRNYLKYFPKRKKGSVLVISCGPGYMVNLLKNEGYEDVLGIDSDPEKIAYAKGRRLNCRVASCFAFLKHNDEPYDMIIAEQEINHLTKREIITFLGLCWDNLREDGTLVIHTLNGANPLTGSEAMAQNFDHYNSFTEYSLRQVLEYCSFGAIRVVPLRLYVFYENPLNYIGMLLEASTSFFFRLGFVFYGKSNRLFSKKIAAICRKKSEG